MTLVAGQGGLRSVPGMRALRVGGLDEHVCRVFEYARVFVRTSLGELPTCKVDAFQAISLTRGLR